MPDIKGSLLEAELVMRREPRKTSPIPLFAPYEPAKGVLPSGHTGAKLAMDAGFEYGGDLLGNIDEAFQEGYAFPGFSILSNWAQISEFRKSAEIYAREMTREWIKIQATGEDDLSEKVSAIEGEFKRLSVQAKFREAIEQDGLFGRSQIFLDTGNIDDPHELKTELVESKIKIRKGALKRLVVVEPIWSYPNRYNANDPLDPTFYKPTSWFVMGREIHSSRLLTIITRDVPDILKPAYAFAGLSLSQMIKPYVDNWLRTRQSVSDLLHSFTVWTLSTDMSMIMNNAGAEDFFRRLQIFNLGRDNHGVNAINKDTEEFSNVSAPLGGLDHLQAQAQEQMCAPSGIPLVYLTGITPSGLNATSEGEITIFKDNCAANQEIYSPVLQKILNIVQLSLFGEIDENITFAWEPLYSMSAAELATTRKSEADTDVAYIDAGVLAPQEVRQKIAGQEESPYAGLDLDESALPEPPENPADDPEMQGALNGNEEPHAQDDAGFKEEDHPRAENGQFGSGGSAVPAAKEKQKKEVISKEDKFAALMKRKTEQDQQQFTAAHKDGFAIPPAWTNVQYFGKSGQNGIIAQGTDAKGRKQRLEDPKYRAAKIAEKQERIANNLSPRMPKITDELRKSANSGNQEAEVLYLITQTGFRIGGIGDGKAKEQAFGATTLTGDHVRVDGSKVMFNFPGKHGVQQIHEVDDPIIAKMMKGVKPGEKIFKTTDAKVRQAWKKYGGEKVHDIRSYVATQTAKKAIESIIPPKPHNEKEMRKLQMEVATIAAKKLGNRPEESLATYINPHVFEAVMKGKTEQDQQQFPAAFTSDSGTAFSENPLSQWKGRGVTKTYEDSLEYDLKRREALLDVFVKADKKDVGQQIIELADLKSYQSTLYTKQVNQLAETFSLEKYKAGELPTVFKLPDGTLLLKDGNHRINAAVANNIKELPVQLFELVNN